MTERDFEINGKKFRLSKINALDQFHVTRRLAPILGELLPVAHKLQKSGLKDADSLSDDQMQMFAPIMKGLAQLSDEDANRVLLGLCGAVEMWQNNFNTWAKIAVGQNFMVQDLDLSTLMQVAGRAFMYNMSGFFASAPQVSHGGA